LVYRNRPRVAGMPTTLPEKPIEWLARHLYQKNSYSVRVYTLGNSQCSGLTLSNTHHRGKNRKINVVRRLTRTNYCLFGIKLNERRRIYRGPTFHNISVISIGNVTLPYFHGSPLFMRM